MIPEGLATLYAFLGLVAPGLLFQLLRERARPALEEGAFREASRVALTSLLFTTASILLLALVSAVLPKVFVDLSAWMRLGAEYVGDNFWLVVWSVLAEVSLACFIAWRVAVAFAKRDDPSVKYSKTSIWHLAILGSRPADKVAWVSAHLADESDVWGYVHYFTTDLPLENRELSLMGPGLAIRLKGKEPKPLAVDYLVIPGNEIRRLKITYEPAAVPDQDES